MKLILVILLGSIGVLNLNAQAYIDYRYEEHICDSIICDSTQAHDNIDTLIAKVVFESNLIFSQSEIEKLYDIEEPDSDTIKLKFSQSIIVVYNNAYRKLYFNQLVKQNSSEFSGSYEDVSLYKIPNINLTEAVGVVLKGTEIKDVIDFKTKTIITDSDTVNSCGEQVRYIILSLNENKFPDLYYIIREPFASTIIDDLHMPDDKYALVRYKNKCYQTGMYWKGQGEFNGY